MRIRIFGLDGTPTSRECCSETTDSYEISSNGKAIAFMCPKDILIHPWSAWTHNTRLSLEYPNESSLSVFTSKPRLPDGISIHENDSMFSAKRPIMFTLTNNSWIPRRILKGTILMAAEDRSEAHVLSFADANVMDDMISIPERAMASV